MRLLSVFLMLSVLLASGSQLWAQKQISDDQIYDQVRRKLASDPVVKGGALEVEVQDGVVTLRGKVREEKQKNKAGRITKKVKGVKQVINELVISPTVAYAFTAFTMLGMTLRPAWASASTARRAEVTAAASRSALTRVRRSS